LLFCVRVPTFRLCTGVPAWGPPPHPGPAVHRYGWTALHYAAQFGNRRIVRSLVASKAYANSQDYISGCAVPACGESAVSAAAESPPPSAVQADAAALGCVERRNRRHRGAAAARRRRGHPEQQSPSQVTLRCAALHSRPKPHSRARADMRRRSNSRNSVGSSPSTRRRRGWCNPPRRLTLRHPLPRAPSLPALLVPTDVPSALADPAGREATAHCNRRPRRAPRRALLHPRIEV
jgi:hypothetical protein